jgi:hypothetical protein
MGSPRRPRIRCRQKRTRWQEEDLWGGGTGPNERRRGRGRLAPLTLSPDHEPIWVRLHVHQVGGKWAALIADDDAPPLEPGALKGLVFFGATPEEAERDAKAYLGCTEPPS